MPRTVQKLASAIEKKTGNTVLQTATPCYSFIAVNYTTYSLPVSRRTPDSTRLYRLR